jgi:hypothetical protein
MNAALGPVCTDRLYLGREQPGLMRRIFWMKHTPDTGSIARPGGLQPNALPIELRLLPYKALMYANSVAKFHQYYFHMLTGTLKTEVHIPFTYIYRYISGNFWWK